MLPIPVSFFMYLSVQDLCGPRITEDGEWRITENDVVRCVEEMCVRVTVPEEARVTTEGEYRAIYCPIPNAPPNLVATPSTVSLVVDLTWHGTLDFLEQRILSLHFGRILTKLLDYGRYETMSMGFLDYLRAEAVTLLSLFLELIGLILQSEHMAELAEERIRVGLARY